MCVLWIRSILRMGIINIRLTILQIEIWLIIHVTILNIIDGCLMTVCLIVNENSENEGCFIIYKCDEERFLDYDDVELRA